MDIKINSIIPKGTIDYQSDYDSFKEGNLCDSINTRIQNDDFHSLVGRELVKGNDFAFFPQAASARNKRFRAHFDTERYINSNYVISMYSPNGAQMATTSIFEISGQPIATVLSNFQTSIISAWASTVTITAVVTTSSTTGFVEFEYSAYSTIPYWSYYTTFTAGRYLVNITTSQQPIDPSLLGNWIPLAGYDLLGDLFCLFTTKIDLPQEVEILTMTNSGGSYLITTTTDFAYIDGGVVQIKSDHSDANGEWTVQLVAPNQFLLLGSVWSADFNSGVIVFYPRSLSEIGVAKKDINNNQWTYTRLARTEQWNLRGEKQPEIGIGEDNIFRKSIYWCDHYNPDRVFYYIGDYITDGAIKTINTKGVYDYNSIGDETKLIITNGGDSSIGYLYQSTGGALLSGSYRYTARFLTDEYTPVGFFLEPTMQMPVFRYIGTQADQMTGDESGTLTTKSNTLVISHPVNTFKYIEVIAIYYSDGVSSAEIVSRYAISEGSSQIIITHTGLESDSQWFNAGLILASNSVWDISKTMRAINNRSTRSNLKKSQQDYDLSEWFKTFKHSIRAHITDANGYTYPPSKANLSFGGYQVAETSQAYGGFMFNECYRMLGKVQWNNGSYSEAFWIDDIKIDLEKHNIDISYPDNRRVYNEYNDKGYFFTLGETINSKTYIPYITFSGFDMNYIINGVSIGSLISKIIIIRTDVIREVLQSGFVNMGVNGQESAGAGDNMLNSIYYIPSTDSYDSPGDTPHTPSVIMPNPYITGGFLPASGIATNPLYSSYGATPSYNFMPQRGYGFFYSIDSLVYRDFIAPANGDILIYYGNPPAISFTQYPAVSSSPEIASPTIANWDGYTRTIEKTMLIKDGIKLEGFANGNNTVMSNIVSNNPAILHINPNAKTFLFQNQPCIALAFDIKIDNISAYADYGFYMAYYYRGISTYDAAYNPDTSKYGLRKNAKGRYLCGTISTKNLTGIVSDGATPGIFGQDVFTQSTTIKYRVPIARANNIDFPKTMPPDPPGNTVGFTGALSFWSQNICNSSLIVKTNTTNTEWNYPVQTSWTDWVMGYDYQNPFTKPVYDTGYSYCPKPSTDIIFDADTSIAALPATIFYSDIKPLNSYSDNFRIWYPLNFADLDLTKGEIVHHEIINGQLFALQDRKFERREFNSSGKLVVTDSSQVVIGDGSVISGLGNEISNIGCSNKFSVVKGRSQGGNDIIYWWNTELKTIVRFGSDGTVPISFIHALDPYIRNNVQWVIGKDTPAAGSGIMGVWNDINKEVIWTVKGVIKSIDRAEWSNTNQYLVGDIVTHNAIQYICYLPNKGIMPPTEIAWILIYDEETGGYTESFQKKFVNRYTLVYSEIQNGCSGFRSFYPNIYMRWSDKYLSDDKDSGRMFEHELDNIPRGLFYGILHDGYDEFVVPAKSFSVEDYGAIRVQSDLEPYNIVFTTNNNTSELNRGDFTFREKWFDSSIRNANFVSPQTFGSKLYGNYIKVGITYLKGEAQKIKGFIIKSKTRSRKSNT